ncbi:MAG TPA: hypothetical protein P5168_02210 [Candidatus Methanomethylicus sp.]|nr:hypothetical protein [Candidatus Methanomethylicus sp.]HRU81343.1 hypothetical protein [Candidatus Methanomethylicus sp.]
MIIDSAHSIGRIALSKKMKIGEGSIRTIIKKLVERGVIAVDSIGGCTLTETGNGIADELKGLLVKRISFNLSEMGIDLPSHAIHIRSELTKMPLTKLRDVAVKNGADGLVIFSYLGGRITLPLMTEDISKVYPALASYLEESFKLVEGDSVLVGFSNDLIHAEEGTLAAALAVVNA